VSDLCDDEELSQAVLSLLDEVQHKRSPHVHSATSSAERHGSSMRR